MLSILIRFMDRFILIILSKEDANLFQRSSRTRRHRRIDPGILYHREKLTRASAATPSLLVPSAAVSIVLSLSFVRERRAASIHSACSLLF